MLRLILQIILRKCAIVALESLVSILELSLNQLVLEVNHSFVAWRRLWSSGPKVWGNTGRLILLARAIGRVNAS